MKNWFSRIGKSQKKSLNLPGPALAPPPFLGGSALRGRPAQLRAYQGWVFAAVNAIAQRASGVPLKLYASGQAGTGIAAHPVLDLLRQPNPIMTRRQLRHTLITHLELTGMAFVLKVRNALGRPAALWPLSPGELLEIKEGGDTARPISAFVFLGKEGRKVEHPPEDILYLRHPSPMSLIYGASPIEAMAHAYDIDLAVRIYQRNFFRNSARPEVVLSTDQRLTEDEARRILTRWNQKHQGLSHVFEPTVLEGGLKAEPLNFSARDFEFMALAGWTQDNILAAYGVPAGKLGLVKDLNRANAQAVDVTFNSECIRPRLDLIEDALNTHLLPSFGDGLVLRHDNPVPTDRAQEHTEAMAQLDRGAITINEFRAAKGLAPVAWGSEPYIPAISALGNQNPQPGTALADQAKALIRSEYPKLLARFHGWSKKRVQRELTERPQLLDPLVAPGAEQASRLRACLAESLEKGLDVDQAIQDINHLL